MRTDYVKNLFEDAYFAVEPNYLAKLVATLNSGVEKDLVASSGDDDVPPSCTLNIQGENAVIRIEGAMIKKHTFFSALCGGFTSYEEIEKHITTAENNKSVKRIIFRVDTLGGDVSGVDGVGEMIYNSSKETITYYENYGCSAGVWAFSASDKIFASEMTYVGSIGVMSTYRDRASSGNEIILVSKRAENKNCSLNGDCKKKVISHIDEIETVFYNRVSRNTGLSEDDIMSKFNQGDIVIASEAVEIGFIDKIVSFDMMMTNLIMEGQMSDQENSPSATTSGLQAELDLSKHKVTSLQAEIVALQATIDKAPAANTLSLDSISSIVAMAFEYDASKDQCLHMLTLTSEAEAGLYLLKSKQSVGSVAPAGSEADLNSTHNAKGGEEEVYVDEDSVASLISEIQGGL